MNRFQIGKASIQVDERQNAVETLERALLLSTKATFDGDTSELSEEELQKVKASTERRRSMVKRTKEAISGASSRQANSHFFRFDLSDGSS